MSKEITKAIILQEMQDKLRLREHIPAKFLFDETVIPVYDITQHLVKNTLDKYQMNVTSSGGKQFKTVPQNERWVIERYTTIFVSGAFTIAGIYITRGDDTLFGYLDLKAAQGSAYLIALNPVVVLNPGDKIWVNVDGFTSSGTFQLLIDYRVEEIR